MTTRPTPLCRSWLFAPGAERDALYAAPASGADVIIQELEDFTPPDRRPEAHALAPALYDHWRAKGAVAAVRINPYHDGGRLDLAAVMPGAPDIVALPKVTTPGQIAALDADITAHEAALNLPHGQTQILPNLESAAGVLALRDIAAASPRVTAVLMASEDLAADLAAPRQPDNAELQYARAKFYFDAAAAGVLAVDYPHTWAAGLDDDLNGANRLGFKAKSCVRPEDAAAINAAFTPTDAEIARARAIVAAFDTARAEGRANARAGDTLVELPGYNNARRLLDRARALGVA